MIRINLIQKKQASYIDAGAAMGAASGALGKVQAFYDSLIASIKNAKSGSDDPILGLVKSIGIPLVVGLIANFGYDYYISQKTEAMTQELAILDQEKEKINKELVKIKGFESVKIELERNELILRAKIDTIEKLIRGRDYTVKSLITFAQAMPRDIWMTELKTTDTAYSIRGGTVDIALVSDFMSRLGQTIYFKDVTLKTTTSDPNGRQAVFELTARRE